METDTSGVGLGAVLAQQIEDGTLTLWRMLVELYSHMNRTTEQQSLRPLEWFGHRNILDTICMDTSV